MAALAGEGEEAFVAAVRTLKAGEAGDEVATAEEGFDSGSGCGVEWPEILAVFVFLAGEEFVPAVADDLKPRAWKRGGRRMFHRFPHWRG